MRDYASLFVVALAVAAVLVGIFMFERAKWRECRRYHPMWYCAMSGSSR